MYNRVILIGRPTKSPELRSTQSNVSFCSFTLAVNRPFADGSGDKQVDFISCVVWRAVAENFAKYVNKGSLIAVEGRLQTRSYEVDGQTKYITEVSCDSVTYLETKSKDEDDEFYETSKKLANEEDMPF